MAVNKVVYGGEAVIDLTSDTVTPDQMLSGVTAHNKSGEKITGTVEIVTVHSGAEAAMTSDVGADGDIYLVTE